MTLKLGCRVKEKYKRGKGWTGVVVKIIEGNDIDEHGTIFVWQEDRFEYGADNCEHYAFFNWQEHLEIISEP